MTLTAEQLRNEAAVIIHTNAVISTGLTALAAQVAPINAGITTLSIGALSFSLIKLLRPDVQSIDQVASGMIGLLVGSVAASIFAKTLVGLVPVLGNLTSAAINFAAVESIGWGMVVLLQERDDFQNVTADEFRDMMRRGKAQRVDVQTVINGMPTEARAQYNAIIARLKHPDLDEDEKMALQAQLGALLAPYMPEIVSTTTIPNDEEPADPNMTGV